MPIITFNLKLVCDCAFGMMMMKTNYLQVWRSFLNIELISIMNDAVRNERKLIIFFAIHSHLTKFKSFHACKKSSRTITRQKRPTAIENEAERYCKKRVQASLRRRRGGGGESELCLFLNQIFYECDKFTRLCMRCR